VLIADHTVKPATQPISQVILGLVLTLDRGANNVISWITIYWRDATKQQFLLLVVRIFHIQHRPTPPVRTNESPASVGFVPKYARVKYEVVKADSNPSALTIRAKRKNIFVQIGDDSEAKCNIVTPVIGMSSDETSFLFRGLERADELFG
jgi:hypothetical protein